MFLQGKHNGFRRNFDYTSKSMKIGYTYSKIHFTHLQQNDENHCVYLAMIECHSEKYRRKRVATHAGSVELFRSE